MEAVMKKLLFVFLLVFGIGCSTFSHNPYERLAGYVITKDNKKIEFTNARVFHYQRDLIVISNGSEMTFDLGDVKTFHIDIR